MSASIRTLDLPARVVKTLTAAGINTVSDVPMRRDDELLSLRGVTADVVHKLRMASGRELSGEPPVETVQPEEPVEDDRQYAEEWNRKLIDQILGGAVLQETRLLARDTYLELVRTKGYSTEHAKHAWAGAVEFVRQGRLAQETLHPGKEIE